MGLLRTMAEEGAWGLLREEKRDFDAMRALYRRRPKSDGEGAPSLGEFSSAERPPIIAVLLDALEAGRSVPAAVLAVRSINEIQVITAYGVPSGGYFRVGFKLSETSETEWTPFFYPMLESAAVLQKYLSDLPSVGHGNVEVTLGLVTLPDGTAHNAWRWNVVWCGRYAGVDMQMLELDQFLVGAGLLVATNNPLEDTGRVEMIREVIGVPSPTPLRAGARCMALWYHGVGYCIHACEARDFGDYGLF